MFSTLRTRFGIPGVISVIALVFAMLGGAYAANNSASGGKATASAKAKRGPRGPKGPAGPQGSAGPQGAKGDAGANGSNGSAGADGKSVEAAAIAAGGACGSVAGVKYTLNATSTNVCNGKNGTPGAAGAAGAPGEAGMCSEAKPECKLGSGATLTGVWSAAGGEKDTALASISLPVHVSPAPTALYRDGAYAPLFVGRTLEDGKSSDYFGPNPAINNQLQLEEDAEAFEEACPGTSDEPKAAPGFLCIYRSTGIGILNSPSTPLTNQALSEAANEFGVVVPFEINSEKASIRGSWAVTG
jgi:hypothetical protein